jgi:hypothetical protein
MLSKPGIIVVIRSVIPNPAIISCGAGGRRWSVIIGSPRLCDGIEIYLMFGCRKRHVVLASLEAILRSVVLILCPFAIGVSGVLRS